MYFLVRALIAIETICCKSRTLTVPDLETKTNFLAVSSFNVITGTLIASTASLPTLEAENSSIARATPDGVAAYTLVCYKELEMKRNCSLSESADT